MRLEGRATTRDRGAIWKAAEEVDDIEHDVEADFFELHHESILSSAVTDEFHEYTEAPRLKAKPPHLYKWWGDQDHIPSMQQFAFDLLSIPAMSAENGRVFSETKYYIGGRCYRLGADIVEALECENMWMNCSVALPVLEELSLLLHLPPSRLLGS